MSFAESTHRKRWLFSAAQLAQTRAKLHAAALACDGGADGHADKKRRLEEGAAQEPAGAVTLEEASKLLRFYEGKVAEICQQCKLPKKVQATALTYFKRYFLGQSVLTTDPLRVLLTCIYTAAKIEESYISADDLCRAVGTDAAAVLKSEVVVLGALRFDLVVHSPYRALVGLMEDIESMRAEPALQDNEDSQGQQDADLLALTPEELKRCRAKAVSCLDALMLTDAPLLLAPGVLALAALRSACRGRGTAGGARNGRLRAYVGRCVAQATAMTARQQVKQEPGHQEKQAAALTALLDQADALGMQGATKVEQQEVSEIDRKIKQWKSQNPSNDAAPKRQAADARTKAEQREARMRAKKEAEAKLLGMAQPATVKPQ